jgi:hypothetical protein
MALVDPRRHLGALCHTAAAATILVGTALPWVVSGERGIDLYEMRRVAYRLEADVDLRLIDPVVVIPLVLAGSLLARWGGHHRIGRSLAVLASLYAGAGALLMIRSPLPTGAGVVVTLIGAIALTGVVAVEGLGGTLRSVSPATEAAPVVTNHHDADGSARSR